MSLARDALQACAIEPNAAWKQAAGTKETAAPLAQLPAGLAFDDALDEPIWYDSARRVLRYRGFMCNASYVHLRRLCEHPAYIAALEQLYLGSALDDAKPVARLLLQVAGPLTVVAAVAGAWLLWLR
jgi:hypothetical protein